ncbi:hypothetical protein [Rhizocola hellebori]|uniref:hypothetical protein n=1 Tax=Rhizocola hellebori TaxID=1392758 RepID=UPI0019406A42|nr:hypothetical protein [Rhizocola hellebori]
MTTDFAVATPAAPQAAKASSLGRRVRNGLEALFPIAPRRALSRRDIWLGIAVVVVAAAVCLLRVTGTGALQSIWQEDGNDLLTAAYYRTGAKTIFDPMNGYYLLGSRWFGVLAAFFPVSWAAAVLSISSALVLGLMVLLVYIATGAHLSSKLARFMVTVPLLIAPVAENNHNEVYARPVCLHLFALYMVFWVLLWAPEKRISKIVAVAAVGLTAASTILTIVFIPLALLRVFVRRDRTGMALLGVLVVFAAANLVLMQNGTVAARGGVMYPEPMVALLDYVVWGLPTSMLGYSATSGLGAFHFPTAWDADLWGTVKPHLPLIVLSWVMVLGIVGLAAIRRFTRPSWPLAAAALTHSVAMLCMMVMAQGNELRYLIPVELLLFAGLVALLLPIAKGRSFARANAPLIAFAVFLAVIGAINFRWDDTYRGHAPRWTDQVHKAAVVCKTRPEVREVLVRSAPEPWGSVIHVPCHRLTEVRPWDCVEPRCVPINGMGLPDAIERRP